MHQSNNPAQESIAVHLEQCWPLGPASSFPKRLQTLYLIIHSGNFPGFIVKLDIYNFKKSTPLFKGRTRTEQPLSIPRSDVPPPH